MKLTFPALRRCGLYLVLLMAGAGGGILAQEEQGGADEEAEVKPQPPYLPLKDEVLTFSGEHWNDDWRGKVALSVEAKLKSVSKTEKGELIQLAWASKVKSAQPRELPELHFLVTAAGAVYRVEPNVNGEVAEYTSLDLVAPDFDALPEFPAEAEFKSSRDGLHWASPPWTTNISRDLGQLVRFSNEHPSGHFTQYVFQRGVGLVEIAMGSGAGQDGFRLRREVAAKGKTAAGANLIELLKVLPEEFFPPSELLGDWSSEKHRREQDLANGWLSVSSNTDGEGETLEAALWKRKDGSLLVGLLSNQWTGGPGYPRALRVAEWREGKFRHVTTDLPLPTEADFYAVDEAEAHATSRLIVGGWKLPRKGGTIVIRPPNEEAAEYLGDSSMENYFFELAWDGMEFERIKLPRVIPAAQEEPQTWVFQDEESKLLYLQRKGPKLSGSLQMPGKSQPVTGEFRDDGEEVSLKLKAGTDAKEMEATLESSGGEDRAWKHLVLRLKPEEGEEEIFEAVALYPEVGPLPAAKVVSKSGVDYPQFDAASAGWKAINRKIVEVVDAELVAFKAAPKPRAEEDPGSLGLRFKITSLRQQTFSLLLSFDRYVGGAHGQTFHRPLNYDFKAQKFLELSDVVTPESAAPLNAALVEQGLLEEGQNMVSNEMMAKLPWTLGVPYELEFHLAPESVKSGSPEATIVLGYEKLSELEWVKRGGALDPQRR